MASKAAKKKQNLEMFDALESTIKRVTDQAQRFRRKMDELVRKVFSSFVYGDRVHSVDSTQWRNLFYPLGE